MNRRWVWGAAAAVAAAGLLALASLQASAAPLPPSPTPSASALASADASGPLNAADLVRARSIAGTATRIAAARDVTGGTGPEYVTAQPERGAPGRSAAVYYYDYATDSLVKVVVDLASGRIVKTFTGTGVQPPASSREVATALDLLLRDRLGDGLRGDYATATGHPLARAADLRATAHIYRAAAANPGAAQCTRHRCLLLTVQVAGGPYIDVDDIIIDLTGRTVVRVG
jgi:hypothetical protein